MVQNTGLRPCVILFNPVGVAWIIQMPGPRVAPGAIKSSTPLGLAVISLELDNLISMKFWEIKLCETNNQLKLYTRSNVNWFPTIHLQILWALQFVTGSKHRASPLCLIHSTPPGLRRVVALAKPRVSPGAIKSSTPLGLAVRSPEQGNNIKIKSEFPVTCLSIPPIKMKTRIEWLISPKGLNY